MLFAIPSPPAGAIHLGPFTLRAYALAILVGIAAAVWIGAKRFATRTEGGNFDQVLSITFWAVPFGIVGARIYHVITTPAPYFGPNGDLMAVFRIWEGGLGVWGAIAFGALGAWIGARRLNIAFPVFADAVAPGVLIAQAIGRFGNWFNQELYGAPTALPWGLRIDPEYLVIDPATGQRFAEGTLFHPTFLYEALWCVAAATLLVWLDRRYKWGHGRVMLAYVAIYCLGRTWIEMLRVDTSEHIQIAYTSIRLNVITSVVLLIAAVVGFVVVGRRYPERETTAWRKPELVD